MTVIVSRPIDKNEAKPATKITNDWAQDIVDSMLCGNLLVYDLSGTFNREQLEYCLTDSAVDTFVHYGHGINECLLGHNNQCILDSFNVDLLKDKIVISINCDSADDFGVQCIEAGALAYIGYDEKVIKELKNRTVLEDAAFLLPYLKSDMKLLDCGCGPGSITMGFEGEKGNTISA